MPKPTYLYEPHEAFGEGLTTRRPWNTSALTMVERLNGRVAMLGFAAALIGEWLTGHGPAGQVLPCCAGICPEPEHQKSPWPKAWG